MKLSKSILIFFVFILSGCAASPEQLEQAKKYDEYSKAARGRAASHGELPGTPENIEGIKRAEEQASSYQRASDKADDTLLDNIFSIIFD